MRLGTASLILCVLMGAPALAQTAPDASPPATTAPATAAVVPPPDAAPPAAPERIICREMPAPTGSRVGSQKVCGTQAQWNAHFHGQAGGPNGIYVPGMATAGGMQAPTATPHGGGHGL